MEFIREYWFYFIAVAILLFCALLAWWANSEPPKIKKQEEDIDLKPLIEELKVQRAMIEQLLADRDERFLKFLAEGFGLADSRFRDVFSRLEEIGKIFATPNVGLEEKVALLADEIRSLESRFSALAVLIEDLSEDEKITYAFNSGGEQKPSPDMTPNAENIFGISTEEANALRGGESETGSETTAADSGGEEEKE